MMADPGGAGTATQSASTPAPVFRPAMAADRNPRCAVDFGEGIKGPEDIDHQLVRQAHRKHGLIPMNRLGRLAGLYCNGLGEVDLDLLAGRRSRIPLQHALHRGQDLWMEGQGHRGWRAREQGAEPARASTQERSFPGLGAFKPWIELRADGCEALGVDRLLDNHHA
jgi:hypothetical protein